MVVDRDCQRLLRLLLTDHVLVEDVLDLLGRRYLGYRLRYLSFLVLRQDLIAQRNALVADVNGRAGDELPDRILGFSAERAAKVFFLGHLISGERVTPGQQSRQRPSLKIPNSGCEIGQANATGR